ncbi:hypothetical protein SNE26_09205 [Mucilaginibacter sp. cycad4]|uniref:hypothetical protein n=1 Tax=Mucilaginibacter sp. cycad4 TaxID=3342096 RepID=UPI002AAAF451|nr:hypothetical protein [Mucilaginibacter gossypii]WPV01950.1 hypothetical protein SNE26_09205 [Mucilaginibacter gossypii]
MATQTLSASAPIERFTLSAFASGPMAEFARLTLYDGRMQVIADDYASITCETSKGLYKLTLKLNEAYTEQYIVLDQDRYENIPTPQTASATLAAGFNTTHEYYSLDAETISREPTADLPAEKGNGALFLFFRYPDEPTFSNFYLPGQRLTDHFKLLDADRRIICDFTENYVREELDRFGWTGFHASLKPGIYYLYYEGRKAEKLWQERQGQPAREMPIHVFEGWQTQGFMTFRNGPVFTSLIFSLAKLDHRERLGFRIQEELTLLEGVLRKFANGIYYLPKDMLSNLAYGKFENPFLGLVAAYSYFKSRGSGQEQFFATVVRNLNQLLGAETPDVSALNALAAAHSNAPVRIPVALRTPAMFAPGFSLVLRQQGTRFYPGVQAGSIAEKCIEKLFHDLVWTSYKPLGKPKELYEKEVIRARKLDVLLESVPDPDLDYEIPSGVPAPAKRAAPGKPRKPAILNSWVANSLVYALQNNEGLNPVNLPQLAAQLQVTPNMLMDTAQKLSRESDKIRAYLSVQQESELSQTFSGQNLDKVARLTGTYLPPAAG